MILVASSGSHMSKTMLHIPLQVSKTFWLVIFLTVATVFLEVGSKGMNSSSSYSSSFLANSASDSQSLVMQKSMASWPSSILLAARAA